MASGDNETASLRDEVCLVTGGTGLVGRALRAVVEAEEPGVTWVFLGSSDCDLTDAADTAAVFAKYRPTSVVHLAARVGGLFANMAGNLEFYEENMRINDHVVQACVAHRVKLVSCLSTCIFPDRTAYPIDETMIHDGPPHASNEGYSYAKRMLEVHSRLCRAAHGLEFVTVVPTNVYGQHDNFSLQHSHVIPGLIHRAVLAKQSGTPFCVAGTGTPLRQFIYSRDLARLLLWALRNYSAPEPLILSCDEDDEVSIGEAAAIIAAAVGVPGPIVFDTSKPDGQHKKTASNARLKALYPGKLAFTPLEDGIQATVEWFTANYPAVRM